MSMPPTVGPNVALVLQRLDLIERKIDWLAERVTWLTYSSAASTQESSDSPDTVRSSSPSRPETTPPSIAPQTRSASEHSWQRLNESPAQAPVNDPLPEDRNVHPAKAPSADAPRATQTEVPQAQHYQPPAPVEPARSFTAQAGPTPMQYAPVAGNVPHMQATNQVGPAGAGQALGAEAQAVPGWAQRAMREGNLGRYLLSGAAAVLVLSAGVSLLALVWDYIPNPVKILGLALIAVIMTAAGARLGLTHPRHRVAAATITGTGGGLGFVAIVGAVLLGGMLRPEPALILMACWGLVLLAVSHMTRVLFTAVVSTLGALVTIGFAVSHVSRQPQAALVTWLMIGIHVTVLALTCTALSRNTGRMRSAAWYPATSMVATATALIAAPIQPMLRVSTVGGTSITLILCALLVSQTMHASTRLWSIGIKTSGWDWGLTAAVLMVGFINLLTGQMALHLAHTVVVITYLLELLLLAAAALAILPGYCPAGWRRAMAIGHEAAFFPLALAGMAAVGDPRVHLFVIVAAMLCLLPAILNARVEPAPILALLGTTPILVPPRTIYSRSDSWSLIISVVISALMVCVAEGLGDRVARSSPVPAPYTAPSRVQPRVQALRVALAAVAFNMTVLVPFLGTGLVENNRGAWEALRMVPGLMAIALIALGTVSPGATPLRVLSGQCRGARYRVGPHGEALPDPTGRQTGAPAPSWIVSVTVAALALVTLSWADAASSTAWKLLLIAIALGLGASATWLLLPWRRHAEVCLSLAIGNSLLMWSSVMVATDVGPGSVLMSVLVLLTGGACIVFGFRARLTILRHYGLTLVLLSVLKLAVVDVASQNSIIRVISLAAAGVVCFVLSLLYNRFAQEQRRESNQAPMGPGSI
ncbi:DUF2339 domain-containing protein [Actinomyces oris]|uniref:DUF2339 domain-containing protein n=1 Tax=Actinomyces oris TaxID=544580 RepID=UPI0022FD51E6|nr:DUF2339 domain-containing protein [Actinomyces oris]WCA41734.1 DUF2339 domain-containing protein [Actinomyces oris]